MQAFSRCYEPKRVRFKEKSALGVGREFLLEKRLVTVTVDVWESYADELIWR
jgi:hypothetical protein